MMEILGVIGVTDPDFTLLDTSDELAKTIVTTEK